MEKDTKFIILTFIILIVAIVSFNLGITGEAIFSKAKPTQTITTISTGDSLDGIIFCGCAGGVLTKCPSSRCGECCGVASIPTTPDKIVDLANIIGVKTNTIQLTEQCEIVCPFVSPFAVSTKCIDSDGGVDFLRGGTCRDSTGTYKDNCVGNDLEEWACNVLTNKCVSVKINCPGIVLMGITLGCNIDKCGAKNFVK